MITILRQKPAAVFVLLAVYFLVQLVIRLILPHSLELDEGQQLFFAQWFAWGYDSQPPLYNWVQYGVSRLLGPDLLSLALLKNLALFASYLCFGLAAQTVLRSRDLAVVATLSLLTIPQIGFEAQRDLTHTVAVIFAACLFLYAFLSTLKTPSFQGYVLTGLAIGLGVLSKYNFVLLPAAAVIAIALDRQFRSRLLDWRILLTGAVALIVALPHGLWFLEHIDLATEQTIGKLTSEATHSPVEQIVSGLSSLFVSFVGFAGLTIAIFGIVYWREFRVAWHAQNQWTRLIGRIMAIAAILLIVLVVFGGANHIKDRWLTPIYLILPLYLATKLEAGTGADAPYLRRFWPVAAFALVALPIVMLVRIPIHGMTGRYEKLNVDYPSAISQILASSPTKPSIVLTIDSQLAGNIRLSAPALLVTIDGYEVLDKGLTADDGQPVLAIWRDRGRPSPELPDGMARWLDAHGLAAPAQAHDMAVPYIYGRQGDLYHFAYAFLYPQAK
ncbi:MULTISPECIES: glycosyltransferase family 39 protein [Alphaproteobacteria]|uniref:Glycosyl transferase n=2 Tax=Alphaproteobacteria TaxID=28211 RepID=A0A512HGD7_9HYPH|nr:MULTISPECIES: glycosyltransferase family 39 protein [Alphaproteobacteria]GEO84450.1 glycosyl transferase [Ciceribacter naphthalenivorans]GLR22413.1 glycosyl transferase [Ciceribacter naphthalenivorans]GLT05269.1 glycosyl transferase [Sphingomonas psychrolutea]